MATLTSTPSISPSSLTVSGTTQASATISWNAPSIPSGATISSCILSGVATASMTKGSATIKVNGTTVTSGTAFSLTLGNSNSTTSVSVTAVGGNKNASGTVTFSNLVYTVEYTAAPGESHLVTFVDWDGTILKRETVSSGNSATAPADPTRDGYTFIGWDVDYSNITSDLTVTAQYTAITTDNDNYTITFQDWVSGETYETISSYETPPDSTVIFPENPHKDGYVFSRWECNDYNGTVVGNHIFQAAYIKLVDRYTFNETIYAPIGDLSEDTYYTQLSNTIRDILFICYKNQDKIRDPIITCNTASIDYQYVTSASGCDLWFTEEPSNGQHIIEVREHADGNPIYINATYDNGSGTVPVSYTVTFVDWDGSTLKTETVLEGGSATPPTDPTRDGYSFIGWDVDYSNITSDLTVTAQYKANTESENVLNIYLGNIGIQKFYFGSLPITAIYFNGRRLDFMD